MEQEVVLEVKNLKTYLYNYDRELRAVDDLSYKVHREMCIRDRCWTAWMSWTETEAIL